MRRRWRFGLLSLLAAMLTIFLCSCPNPIPTELSVQISDITGPVITITEPADRSEYSTVVRVSGTISDPTPAESLSSQAAMTCGYEVLGTDIRGDFLVENDGAFSFWFSTRDFAGMPLVTGIATVEVTAMDWNGNASVVQLQIVPSETGDIPNFRVEPNNHAATITWDPVPFADRYEIVEYNSGMNLTDVTSPCVIDGLANGRAYAFQLTALVEESFGVPAVSSTVAVLPLSPRTFAPWIRETGYKSIAIEWWESPDVSQYIVERKAEGEGNWAVRQSVVGNCYIDTSVLHDTRYSYRLTASERPNAPSESITAVPGRFGFGVMSSVDLDAMPWDVSVDGSVAYLTQSSLGLGVVDVANPESPASPSYIHVPDYPRSVVVQSQVAYVAHGESVSILDVNDPLQTDVLSVTDLGDRPGTGALRLRWPYLYVRFYSSTGLGIIDVSDPVAPTGPFFVFTQYQPNELDIHDSYVYLATTTDLVTVGVADPENPSGPFFAGLNDQISSIHVEWPYAYAFSSDNLYVFDVTNPESPSEVASIPVDAGHRGAICSFGSFIVVRRGQRGLSVFDTSDPLNPSYVATVDTGNTVQGLTSVDSRVFVASRDEKMVVVELSEPTLTPDIVHVVDGTWEGVATCDSYMYSSRFLPGEFVAVDVSDPVNPGTPVFVEAPDPNLGLGTVYCTDANLFCGVQAGGFLVYDILADGGLSLVSHAHPGLGLNGGISIVGDYLYQATLSEGLAAVDISDLSNTTVVALQPTEGGSSGVVVRDQHAFMAVRTAGFGVMDVSDPASPQMPYYLDTQADNASMIALGDHYAYLSCYTSSDTGALEIIDIADITNPTWVATVPFVDPAYPPPVAVGPYVFVPIGGSGIAVVSVHDPLEPEHIGNISVGGNNVQGLHLAGSIAYVATSNGLKILRLAQ